jgi:uncharacterized protein (DUF433 family)
VAELQSAYPPKQYSLFVAGKSSRCRDFDIIIKVDILFLVTFMDYQHIITIEPGKRSGKPCIRGMRITVYDILEYLASGMSEAEILEDFSELTSEDIKACLAFAADREKKLFVASL